jgi:uncharacterized SAM-binding protein YcdF (DUF218 family)
MKVFIKLILIFLLSLSSAAAIVFLSLGFIVSQHAGSPEKSDVIIVLGGDNGLRVRKGAELYKAGYATHIILTGIDERFYHPGHPNWRERRMMELGVPKDAIKVDARSTTTWEEAENTSDSMEEKGWKSAIVVSDPPHMLRLHQTWSIAFEGSSKKFILVPTNPIWWHPLIWWINDKSYQFVINEIKKNLFYALVYY